VTVEFLQNVGQFTIPDGFRGHGVFLCYCASAQNAIGLQAR
jgi:hypothetical protein